MRQQPRLLNVGIGSDERPTPDEIFTPLHQELRIKEPDQASSNSTHPLLT